MTITELQQKAHRTAKEHGFWENFPYDSTWHHFVASKLALVHAEVSEALEEVRRAIWPGDLVAGAIREDGKPEGFASELADIIIRVLDLAEGLDLNLEPMLEHKMAFNETREHRHGKAL